MLCNKDNNLFPNKQFFLAQSVPLTTIMTLLFVIYSLWATMGALWVIVRRLDPLSAWVWGLSMFLCPPLATLLYWLTAQPSSAAATQPRRSSDTRLQRLIHSECGSAVSRQNALRPLHNADQTFCALIRDLQRARSEILIQYYILGCDRLGRAVARLLMRRARAGVRVCVLYDAIGSYSLSRRELERLRQSGIQIRAWGRLRFPLLRPQLNCRNHRKIVVVDGHIAYIGGINIATRYVDGGRHGFWRDEHLRIEGDAAAHLHELFRSDWLSAGGEELQPLPEPKQSRPSNPSHPLQIIHSAEGPTRHAIERAIIEAICSARHNIRISTPYLLPPPALLEAICIAARSGVEVELLIPARSDVRIAGLAAEAFIRYCVRHGVKIYRYRNGFLHSKLITIDESVAIVGSANLDYRSLCYNLEASVAIYSPALVREYNSRFYTDLALSEPVSRLQRPTISRLLAEGLARLLAPLL